MFFQIVRKELKKHNNLDNLRGFSRESFDRILLDPPCSALGLRPKLGVSITAKELKKAATYQRAFLLQAMDLLKPGGILTYSTCTINPMENEGNVAYMMRNFGDQLKLLPVPPDGLGQAGLHGSDLLEEERLCVKRFDPTDRKEDCMGFFLAKFQKRSTESHRVQC
jgi:methyltransferase NSUN6